MNKKGESPSVDKKIIGQGAVITVQGVGASLSPAIGGWMAQGIGYPTTFMILGSFASVSILLWLLYSKTLRKKCDNQPEAEPCNADQISEKEKVTSQKSAS